LTSQSFKLSELLELSKLANDITFNAENHIYSINGSVLPSVTTMLLDLGLINTKYFKQTDAEKGHRIHHLLELLDQDKLDWESLTDPELIHVQNWNTFKLDYGVDILMIEQPIYHPIYLYAGTIDRFALVKGKLAVIDIKSGYPMTWHQLQLGLYGMIVEYVLKQEIEMYDVYTKRYTVRKVPREIYNVCEAVLTLWRWKYEV